MAVVCRNIGEYHIFIKILNFYCCIIVGKNIVFTARNMDNFKQIINFLFKIQKLQTDEHIS